MFWHLMCIEGREPEKMHVLQELLIALPNFEVFFCRFPIPTDHPRSIAPLQYALLPLCSANQIGIRAQENTVSIHYFLKLFCFLTSHFYCFTQWESEQSPFFWKNSIQFLGLQQFVYLCIAAALVCEISIEMASFLFPHQSVLLEFLTVCVNSL